MASWLATFKDLLGSTLVPLGLVAAAILMGWIEIRSYQRTSEHALPLPRANVRLFRRLFGCLSIGGIGVLVFIWMHQVRPFTLRGGDHHLAEAIMFGCVGLVLLAIGLAVWDAIDGISSLKKVVDEMHSADLSDLEAAMRRHERRSRN